MGRTTNRIPVGIMVNGCVYTEKLAFGKTELKVGGVVEPEREVVPLDLFVSREYYFA